MTIKYLQTAAFKVWNFISKSWKWHLPPSASGEIYAARKKLCLDLTRHTPQAGGHRLPCNWCGGLDLRCNGWKTFF